MYSNPPKVICESRNDMRVMCAPPVDVDVRVEFFLGDGEAALAALEKRVESVREQIRATVTA